MKYKSCSHSLVFPATLLSICIAMAVPPAAPETTTSREDAFTSVSLVAVGDPPDPRFKIANSRMKLQNVPEAEYPPTLLHVPKPDEKDKTDMITLGLNLPGQQVKLKGTNSLRLMEAMVTGGETTYKEWTTVKLPVMNEDLAVFLYRSSPGASWRNSPRAIVLRNGPQAFPAHHVRLINLSRKTLLFQLENAKTLSLGPMEFRVVPAGQGEYYSYSVAYKEGDKLQIVARQQACCMRADSRINLVAYESDTAVKCGRLPVTLRRFNELPQTTKVDVPDAGKP